MTYRLAKGCSNQDVSWAWVDPKGKIHEVDVHGHAAWATTWGEPLGLTEGQAYQKLFDDGWIRVTNFLNLEAERLGAPAYAWATVAEMVAGCVSQWNVDKEVSILARKGWIWHDINVGDFIERFGGRALANRAFERFVAVSARRVAARVLSRPTLP